MRYFLLTLALATVGCGTGEAIEGTSSPVGCWQSDTGRLDLMPTGQWQQTFNVSPTTDSGTWTYDAGLRELQLSIANASSANGPAITTWRVTELTSAEMWTDIGAVTHWHSIACGN